MAGMQGDRAGGQKHSKQPVQVVCLVLIDQEGCMLATRRPPGKRLALHWEFPGGKVEQGESPFEALVREIAEELRFSVGDASPLKPVVHQYEFGSIELIPFVFRCATRPAVNLTEHTELRWVRPGGAMQELKWAPADLPIIDQLQQWLLDHA